jgi:flavin-dependent dehydrogenase
MRDSAQVGIVGAGPAGARAAELLAREGVDVVLIDPKAPWEKPCGGGLTPALFDEIPDLRDAQHLARPVREARIELGPHDGFLVSLDAPIWMISREALARWQLARAIGAGALHLAARVSRIERTGRGWLLDTDVGRLEVSALVGADGAASTVRAAVAPTLPVELIAARVAYPRGEGLTPGTLVLRFNSDLVGYLWDFPRLDHRSIGIEAAAGPRTRAELDQRIDAFRREWAAADGEAGDLGAGVPRAGAVIGTARLGHGDFSGIAGVGFALLGDAAGLADPFTGEGIRSALRSADLFVRAWRMGRDWRITYPALARQAFARDLAVARLLRRTLSETGAGVRLIEWALASRVAYAVAATTLNAANLHDYTPRRLVRLFSRALASRLRAA